MACVEFRLSVCGYGLLHQRWVGPAMIRRRAAVLAAIIVGAILLPISPIVVGLVALLWWMH